MSCTFARGFDLLFVDGSKDMSSQLSLHMNAIMSAGRLAKRFSHHFVYLQLRKHAASLQSSGDHLQHTS